MQVLLQTNNNNKTGINCCFQSSEQEAGCTLKQTVAAAIVCAFTQCRRGEDLSSGLRETIVAVQSGKGYEAISKQFEIHHPTV